DILVQKAPACTIGVLAEALSNIFEKKLRTKIIGTRHGEKLYETLVSREEMARAEDIGRLFRIPLDDRDLNYSMYLTAGEVNISKSEDFTSHNTHRLNVAETMRLLLKVQYVRDHLSGEATTVPMAYV